MDYNIGGIFLAELIKDEVRDWGPIGLEFSVGAFRLEVGDKIVAAAVRGALKKHGFSAVEKACSELPSQGLDGHALSSVLAPDALSWFGPCEKNWLLSGSAPV